MGRLLYTHIVPLEILNMQLLYHKHNNFLPGFVALYIYYYSDSINCNLLEYHYYLLNKPESLQVMKSHRIHRIPSKTDL